jgi:heme oxygenase
MRLPAGAGTAFYDFGDRAATAARTQAFRAALQEAVVVDADEVIAEAKRAFERHRQLFDELARRAGLVA